MGLNSVLQSLGRGNVTPVTPVTSSDVTREAPCSLAVTPVTLVTPEKANVEAISSSFMAAMTPSEEKTLFDWLADIGETDPDNIATTINRCQNDLEARKFFLGEASKPLVRDYTLADIAELDKAINRLCDLAGYSGAVRTEMLEARKAMQPALILEELAALREMVKELQPKPAEAPAKPSCGSCRHRTRSNECRGFFPARPYYGEMYPAGLPGDGGAGCAKYWGVDEHGQPG